MASETIRRAIEWAVGIAGDPAHGYSQVNRWGPDYDCSSFVITAFEQAGISLRALGASTTFDMVGAFVRAGFTAIPYKPDVALLEGDVLIHRRHHTALYIGDGQVVHASIDERGGITGPVSGDQTGREICARSFYTPNYGWEYILRWTGAARADVAKEVSVMVSVSQCKNGDRTPEVGAIQTLLNSLGYKGKDGKILEVDSSFGINTDFAVRSFQGASGLDADGVVGQYTWQALLKSRYSK